MSKIDSKMKSARVQLHQMEEDKGDLYIVFFISLLGIFNDVQILNLDHLHSTGCNRPLDKSHWQGIKSKLLTNEWFLPYNIFVVNKVTSKSTPNVPYCEILDGNYFFRFVNLICS